MDFRQGHEDYVERSLKIARHFEVNPTDTWIAVSEETRTIEKSGSESNKPDPESMAEFESQFGERIIWLANTKLEPSE